jgi:outer membrane autotransporter protein
MLVASSTAFAAAPTDSTATAPAATAPADTAPAATATAPADTAPAATATAPADTATAPADTATAPADTATAPADTATAPAATATADAAAPAATATADAAAPAATATADAAAPAATADAAAPAAKKLVAPKLAAFDRTQTASDAAFGTATSFTGNTVPANGDLVKFSKASGLNGKIVADRSLDVMLDLAGTDAAEIKVNDTKTLTLGGVINSSGAVTQGLIVSIDGSTVGDGGTLNLDVSGFAGYGASNIKSGDYSGLAKINFTAGADGVVNIKANNFKSGVVFDNAASASGTVNLGDGTNTTNITLSGDMGALATPISVAFKALDKSNTTFTGSVFSNSLLAFSGASQVTLSGKAYAFNRVNGAATSTLVFAGDKQVSFGTNTGTSASGTVNVSVDGSTAVTHTDGGAAQGMKINTLSFTNISKAATGGSFQLANGKTLANYGITTITSDSNNSEVRFSGANQVLVVNSTVGAADKIINFKFMDEAAVPATPSKTFTINEATKFFGRVSTNVNGVGSVVMNVVDAKVYSLGELGKKLEEVAFNESGENLGDTYAGLVTIADGKTAKLGGTVDALVKLGTNDNAANLILRSGVNLLGDIKQDGGSSNNIVTFLGSANEIGNIGELAPASSKVGGPIAAINFDGARGSVANFRPGVVISGDKINFKDTAINISRGDIAINGVTNANINSNITLGSSELTLNGNATLGSNTSITTTLTTTDKTNVQAGSINVVGTVDVAANSNIVINVTPGKDLPLAFSKTKVVNVSGSTTGTFNLNGSQFTVNGKSSAYSKITESLDTANKNDLYLTGIDNSSVIVPLDVNASGGDSIDQQNAALLTSATSGDAALFIANTSQIDSANAVSAIRGDAFLRLTNSNSVQIASVNQRLLSGFDNAIIERVSDTALQVNRNELGQGAPAAAGDEASAGGAPMGAWLAPVYSQETQKGKGGSAGYKVKSGGAIVGIDTQANDNLIIGAAATMVSSDMKMKDYKAGDKAKINSFMFSVYGAQELVRDFFVQGVASFSSSKIKGKERRIVPTSTNANGYEIANANYDSIGFSGKVLFGYNAKPMEGVFLTPVAGLRYSKTNDESYTETGTSNQNKSLSKQSGDRVDAIVGIQVETNVKSQGIAFVPEAHVYVTHKVGGKSGKVNATLGGLNTSFTGRKDTASKTLYNAGLGVKTMYGAMEYGAGYDAYFASKYIAHQGSLKVRVNF